MHVRVERCSRCGTAVYSDDTHSEAMCEALAKRQGRGKRWLDQWRRMEEERPWRESSEVGHWYGQDTAPLDERDR